MLSQLFSSSNPNPPEKKPEPSGDLLGSILGNIVKPATDKKPSNAPKSTSNTSNQISKPSTNGKSSDKDREEHRIQKRAPEGDKERSRDAERSRDSYSNRNGASEKSARNGAGDYDPLGNSGIRKESSKPKLGREDSLDIPIKKKPADPSRRDGEGSPKIKKREPSSPIIKKKDPSSLPPKKPETSAPTKKPDSSAPIRKPETSAPIRKPDSTPQTKRPETSKSPAPRPSAPSSGNSSNRPTSSGNSSSKPPSSGNSSNKPPSSGNSSNRPPSSGNSSNRPPSSENSSSRPPQKPSSQQSSRPMGPVQAKMKGLELERKLYPGAAAPQKPQLKPSSNTPTSAKPGLSKPSGPSGSGSGSLSKPPQRPSSGSAPQAQGGKPLLKPNPNGPAKPSSTPSLIKKPVPGSQQPPAKPGIRPGSTGSAPPKTMTGKPLLAAKPPMRREDVPKDRVRPMNAPPNRPGVVNGKRPNEKGLSSRHEPDIQKKPKLTQAERGNLLHDIFKGKPKKPMGMMGKGRGGYSDEEDDYDHDSFIDDGSDPDDEARKELDKMMGMYRHKVQKRRGWEEESSDMETGFDDLQVEESYSRHKARLEDQAEFEHIRKEAMEEEKRKKKKKLQID